MWDPYDPEPRREATKLVAAWFAGVATATLLGAVVALGVPTAIVLTSDLDRDGVSTVDELQRGTSAWLRDTDQDLLADGAEPELGTDPLYADTDGDALLDGVEVSITGSDPLRADSDGDGLNDGEEVRRLRTDPLLADTDGDSLGDAQELALKLDPRQKDTDGDGLADGLERARGSSATDPASGPTTSVVRNECSCATGGAPAGLALPAAALLLVAVRRRSRAQDLRSFAHQAKATAAEASPTS